MEFRESDPENIEQQEAGDFARYSAASRCMPNIPAKMIKLT